MNHWLVGAWATCSFELRRSFTVQRTAVSLVLALFPPTMLALIVMLSRNEQAIVQDLVRLVTVLLVAMVCLLSLLLWATPNVYSELEGKGWGFIASRPGGRVSVFLGKYLASLIVSFGISLIAISLCVIIADRGLGIPDPQGLWIALAGVFLLGCLVYAAVFSMIGTLFIKRAMVVAAGYLVGSDMVLASIPGALINKLTLRYHLQEIGIGWIGWFVPGQSNQIEYRMMYGPAWPVWVHVLIITGITIAALAIGGWIIVNREYITTDET